MENRVAFIDPCIVDDFNCLRKELILRGHRLLAYAPYTQKYFENSAQRMKGGE